MNEIRLGILRVEGRAGIPVREFRETLHVLEKAYNGISNLYAYAESASHHPTGGKGVQVSGGPAELLQALQDYGDISLDTGSTWCELELLGADLKSPGFFEFLGALNPLECLRRYACDRHERKKDKEYRNTEEKRSMQAENASKEAAAVKEWVAVLQQVGYPPEQIRQIIEKNLLFPMQELSKLESGVIIKELEAVPE